MSQIPNCPEVLPQEMGQGLRDLGRAWVASKLGPTISSEVKDGWRALIKSWEEDETLPLLIRKSSAVRGSELIHSITGRRLVPCDNSPAQWACHLAISGIVPSVEEVKDGFLNDRIPVSFALRAEQRQRRKYHCTLGGYTINKAGWKLCHVQPIGLRSGGAIEDLEIEKLRYAFRNLIDPANFFLLPMAWGGLGETNEFVEGVLEALSAGYEARQ